VIIGHQSSVIDRASMRRCSIVQNAAIDRAKTDVPIDSQISDLR
jgi:hypothetical protein